MKLGDIVLYHLGVDEDLGGNHNPRYGAYGRTAPAIVVSEGNLDQGTQTYVNIKILTDAPDDVWRTSIILGTGPGQVSER